MASIGCTTLNRKSLGEDAPVMAIAFSAVPMYVIAFWGGGEG